MKPNYACLHIKRSLLNNLLLSSVLLRSRKMGKVLSATTILLLLHVAQSYILLTANMDDVHAIAKQMLSSPVVDQIGKIWRRATVQFNQRLRRPDFPRRTDQDIDSEGQDGSTSSRSRFLSDSIKRRSRRVLDDLSELSKNASEYVQSLRRVFNEFTKQ